MLVSAGVKAVRAGWVLSWAVVNFKLYGAAKAILAALLAVAAKPMLYSVKNARAAFGVHVAV